MALARGRLAFWWLGGFSLAGAIVAPLIFAILVVDESTLALVAIAIPGAIVGLLVGFGIAQAIVLLAEEIELMENPRFPRLGRFLLRLSDLLDEYGP